MIESKKKPLTILLASPRGFCAGVDRAILIVERAIERYGRPVYVRHEIVHNRTVVASLEAKGAIFVEALDEVPDDRPVVLTAARCLGITAGDLGARPAGRRAGRRLPPTLRRRGRGSAHDGGKVVFKLPRSLLA